MTDLVTELDLVRKARDVAYGQVLNKLEDFKDLPTPERRKALEAAEKEHERLRTRFLALRLRISDPSRAFQRRTA